MHVAALTLPLQGKARVLKRTSVSLYQVLLDSLKIGDFRLIILKSLSTLTRTKCELQGSVPFASADTVLYESVQSVLIKHMR